MLDKLRMEAASLLSGPAGLKKEALFPTVESSREGFGDLSSKAAFLLAREKKENPAKIAAELAAKVGKKHGSFSKIEAAGPYVNFYLSDGAYAKILKDILSKKGKYGMGAKKKRKVLLEFPSVNPNKPWHIGHLRNAILGESVARVMEFDGNTVEKMDYIDDLGLQVAQSLWGVMRLGAKPSGKFDTWLGGQYVDVSKRFESSELVADDVRLTLKKMEEGNNEVAEKGRQLAEDCVKAQYQTAFDFGIYHDVLVFESDIMRTLFAEGVEKLKKCSAVVHEKEGKNAGCWVVKLPEDFGFGKMENPDKVLIRSDGTAVYTGKDAIFHLWKFGKLKKKFRYEQFIGQPNGKAAYKTSQKGKEMPFGGADEAINVIGVEQKYPQRVIAEVFRRLGFDKEASHLHHLSYEHVGLPEASFSGRAGTWVGYTADDLLKEARQRVMDKIKLDVSEEEKLKISKAVGVAAIKFTFLKTSSDKRITFKWEEALNMEGDSGPYVQYAYVRTRGILRKTKDKPAAANSPLAPEEKALIKRLAGFRGVVERCSKELAPHHVPQYVLDVAADFARFYGACPVLSAEEAKVRRTRLAIVLATSIVLENTLYLLGIECPEKM